MQPTPQGVHVGSRVVNVRSPVDEFEDAIEALRRAKYDLLEMELAGFARGFAVNAGSYAFSSIHVGA